MGDSGSRLRIFLAELRRRHVFRVAVVYGIVAFVVLQVADIAFPALQLPDWTLTFVVLLAILGFPITMVLAWIFDITHEGVQRTEALEEPSRPSAASSRTVAIVAVVAVVALAIVAGWLVVSKSFEWSLASASRGGGSGRTMLAVLPFENLGKPGEEYFAEGITEEITARLASIQGLGIIARTSAIRYRKSDKTIQQIGEELGVQYILEGTVRWEYSEDGPDRVRVTPQLIRVSDATHIWANIFEEPIASVFQVQTEIAERVAEALDVNLLEPERVLLAAKLTENVEAYEYFLRGNKYAESGATDRGGREALELYRMAVELDPDFEEAAMKLAEAEADFYWANRTLVLQMPGQDYGDRLRRLSSMSFGSDTASYHIARAMLLDRLDEPEAARAQFDSAQRIASRQLEESPSDPRTHAQLGLAFAALGRPEDAVREGRVAIRLAPLDEKSNAGAAWAENLAHIYVLVGEYDAAIDVLEQLLETGSPLTAAWLQADPTWEDLRNIPRFQELMWDHG